MKHKPKYMGIYESSIGKNNLIQNNGRGIRLVGIFSKKNSIVSNTITDNWNGLVLSGSRSNSISLNTIKNNTNGIRLESHANRNDIFSNIIKNNTNGIDLSNSSLNKITKNNFLENDQHAYFNTAFRTKWRRNYWSDWERILPKIIKGTIHSRRIPWRNFDCFPSKVPF